MDRRKLPGKEIDHWDRENSEDQGNDAQIPFWFCKGIKLMGKDEEKGRMEKGWIFCVEFYLALDIVPRIVKGIYLIHPQRFMVEGIESQEETYDKSGKKNRNLAFQQHLHLNTSKTNRIQVIQSVSQSPYLQVILGPKEKDTLKRLRGNDRSLGSWHQNTPLEQPVFSRSNPLLSI